MQMTCEPIISDVSTYQNGVLLISHDRGEGVVSKSVGPASGRLGVRIPAASDLRLKKQVVTAPLLESSARGVSVMRR